MARIRTIKPSFFRHEALFEAERETGLPLRVAFAGLWTAADREGRFKWEPRTLKLDCLPYDEVDFSRVLDALSTRGFIVRYASDGREFGCIPSWKDHQAINNREVASSLPEPNENNTLTRAARVLDALITPLDPAPVEGKGREGNMEGKGEDAASAASSEKYGFESGVIKLIPKDVAKWEKSYSHLDLRAELLGLTQWAGKQSDWYFAVQGALAKRNREAKLARDRPAQSNRPVQSNGQPWPEGII